MSLLDDLQAQYENARESAAAAYENIAGATSSAIDAEAAARAYLVQQAESTASSVVNAPIDAAARARAAVEEAASSAQQSWSERLRAGWENLTAGPRDALNRAEGWARWIAIGFFVLVVLAIIALIAYAYFFFKAAGGIAAALGPDVAKGIAQGVGAGIVA